MSFARHNMCQGGRAGPERGLRSGVTTSNFMMRPCALLVGHERGTPELKHHPLGLGLCLSLQWMQPSLFCVFVFSACACSLLRLCGFTVLKYKLSFSPHPSCWCSTSGLHAMSVSAGAAGGIPCTNPTQKRGAGGITHAPGRV